MDGLTPSLKIYHELMANKVGDILLVSCPYDAFIMEEEGRLSTRIINEYKGLTCPDRPGSPGYLLPKRLLKGLKEKNLTL